MAYLSDTSSVTNTFTVGNVKVKLTEPDYPGNGSDEVKNQTPGQETPKNPKITNTGINDAVVFLKVSVPVRKISPITDGKITGEKSAAEMFYFKLSGDPTAQLKNHFRESWTELPSKEEGTNLAGAARTYVFGYSKRIAKNETTDALFDRVKLAHFIEEEIGTDDALSIDISTYAIQADHIISSGSELSTSGTISKDTLEKIYDAYVLQN